MQISEIVTDAVSRLQPSVEVNNSDLTVWVKRHFYRAVTLIQRYNETKFSKVIEINLLNGVQEYRLPDDCFRVYHANMTTFDSTTNLTTGEDLKEIDFRDIKNIGGDNQLGKGPCYYVRSKNVGIFPKPTTNSVSKIRVWYAYEPIFSDDTFALLPLSIQLTLSDGVVAEYLSQDNQYSAASNQLQLYEKRLDQLCKEFANASVRPMNNLATDEAIYAYTEGENAIN